MGTLRRAASLVLQTTVTLNVRHITSQIFLGFTDLKSIIMPYPEEQLKAAFDNFDKDSSGFISKAEFKAAIVQGLGLSEEDAEGIAKNCLEDGDASGDGKMSFEEFKGHMNK